MSLTAVRNSNLKYPVRDCCTGTQVNAPIYLNINSGIFYSHNGNALNQRSKGGRGHRWATGRGFHHVLKYGFFTWFCNNQTNNSVALEGWWGIIWEMWRESEFILHKICILFLQLQK